MAAGARAIGAGQTANRFFYYKLGRRLFRSFIVDKITHWVCMQFYCMRLLFSGLALSILAR